jgi:UDP-glucose 4-epimerase
MMSLDDAIDLVMFAFEHGKSGDIFVQKARAATIETLANVICDLVGMTGYPRKIIGIRHGEKMFETLLTDEELVRSVDMGEYFRVPADNRDLNYAKFFDEGSDRESGQKEYNSHNAKQLNEVALTELLKNTREVSSILAEVR